MYDTKWFWLVLVSIGMCHITRTCRHRRQCGVLCKTVIQCIRRHTASSQRYHHCNPLCCLYCPQIISLHTGACTNTSLSCCYTAHVAVHPSKYSRFRVSSPVWPLHTAITHVIIVLELRSSPVNCHWNSHEPPWFHTLIMRVIAVCNSQTGLETLKRLYIRKHIRCLDQRGGL